MGEDEKLIRELTTLKLKHQQLDDHIERLSEDGCNDQLRLRRLKKEKLVIKDKISEILNTLHPDIIA